MMAHYWLSTTRMTVMVEVRDGVITDAPPIVRRFLGQPIHNLVEWMRRQPEFRFHRFRD